MMSSMIVRKSISIFLDARPHRHHHPPPPPPPPADLIQDRGSSKHHPGSSKPGVIQTIKPQGHPRTEVTQTPPPGVRTI